MSLFNSHSSLRRIPVALFAMALFLVLGACSTLRGAAIGTAAGATAGLFTGNVAKSAAVGAASGAAGGFVAGQLK